MTSGNPATMSPPHKPSLRSTISRRFLKSLVKIRMLQRPATEGSILRRGQRIKIAAYSSMARAAGPRRVWSRALLAKLRGRAMGRRRLQNQRCLGLKRNRAGSRNRVLNDVSRADELRRLLPGGKAMDLCNLLEETSHFIQCLETQVKLMQSIVDRSSV